MTAETTVPPPRTITGSHISCGILALVDKGGRAWTIAVLPKTWALPGPLCCAKSHTILLRQGQTLELAAPCFVDFQPEVASEDEGEEDEPDQAEFDDNQVRKAGRLLIPGWRKPSKLKAASQRDQSEIDEFLGPLLTVLSWAMPDLPVDKLGYARNPHLRRIMEALFVNELRANLKWLRRGYVPQTEELGMVRGRVEPVSAARAQDSGQPSVVCHFEEFTEAIPHFRVLVTALDRVGAGSEPGLPLVTRGRRETHGRGHENTRSVARQLRHLLADLQPMAVGAALHVARRVPLPPAQRLRWKRAMDLATALLAQEATSPTPDDRANAELAVPTASLYERWVAHCLALCGDAGEGFRRWTSPPPWKYHKGLIARPLDLVLELPGRLVLIDCKFKRLADFDPKGKQETDRESKVYKFPSVQDVNQVFAYVCAGVRKEYPDALKFPRVAALVYLPKDYVGRIDGYKADLTWTKREGKGHWCHTGEMNMAVELHILRFPFPSQADFSAERLGTTLGSAANELGKVLREALGALVAG